MSTLTVRDIPAHVYERLREQAARNHRSMSGEIVSLLEDALLPRRADTEALIADAEAFHARFATPLPDLSGEARRTGRRYDEDLADGGGAAPASQADEVTP